MPPPTVPPHQGSGLLRVAYSDLLHLTTLRVLPPPVRSSALLLLEALYLPAPRCPPAPLCWPWPGLGPAPLLAPPMGAAQGDEEEEDRKGPGSRGERGGSEGGRGEGDEGGGGFGELTLGLLGCIEAVCRPPGPEATLFTAPLASCSFLAPGPRPPLRFTGAADSIPSNSFVGQALHSLGTMLRRGWVPPDEWGCLGRLGLELLDGRCTI